MAAVDKIHGPAGEIGALVIGKRIALRTIGTGNLNAFRGRWCSGGTGLLGGAHNEAIIPFRQQIAIEDGTASAGPAFKLDPRPGIFSQ
jgi:hypothetical protein